MINPSDYNYDLPQANLALEPAVPRDNSRLFVYSVKEDKVYIDRFFNLDKYLPNDCFMVFNNTQVLPARVTMIRLHQGCGKQIRGRVNVLFLVNEPENDQKIRVMVDRKVNVGDFLCFDDENKLEVVAQNERFFSLRYDLTREELLGLLKKYGAMPIPPYLKKTNLKKDELLKKYQTIFARAPTGARLASAAAPTASLHFTDRVFEKIDKKGIERYFITLHVGLGTFAPVTEENVRKKTLHREYFEVDTGSLQLFKLLKSRGKKLLAVGTTVVRTLESISKMRVNQKKRQGSNKFFSFEGTRQKGEVRLSCDKNYATEPLIDKTDLFIFPSYDFKMVDALLTNFHLPKSSLMMLVEAFLRYKKARRSLVELYEIAIKENFRFYSFGDAMLIK